MKNFWPHRSKVKGFSIENLARNYRLRMSNSSHDEISNQRLGDKNFISTTNQTNKIELINLSINKTHWANRDFSEYKEAA